MSSSERRGRRGGLARWLLVTAISLVAGCGFHLRGDASYTFHSLYVSAPADNPLTTELKRAIAAAAGTRLAESPAKAQVILDVTGIVDDKQVLSLSGGGRVREFLLIKRATISLHDATGHDWLLAAEIQVRRSYTFNEAQVLAREAQEVRLLKEMQSDLVQQIVRRLQAAKPPPA
ncbi:MAG: LPS assembly lipoprotein LptE [Casimicrobiaceae bacterium]